jgi:thiol:disulfide interchange protein
MVDRAVCAGAAVGAGLLLIVQQVFADTPTWGLMLIGIVLVVLGIVGWSDLREEAFAPRENRS